MLGSRTLHRSHRALVSATLSLLLAASAPLLLAQAAGSDPVPVRTQHAMVVSIQHNATDAGVEILKAGGNAVDAAVAVGFALAVCFPQAGNLGGGGFMLVRMKDHNGRIAAHFLDYREKAPAAASADMYLDAQGNVVPGLSTSGYRAIGVPGSVAGLTYAERTYGRLTLQQVMAPAIRLATEGFVLSDEEAHNLANKNMAKFPESRRLFQRDGNLYQPGDRLVQPELAQTLRRIAANPDDLYHGAMAGQIADFLQHNGGLITRQDLATYAVKDREPLYGRYHGYDIVTSPPPSSGGIVLLETLNILAGYDLHKVGADRSPEQVHLITEAFRRAYMDRGDYLGDPDFTTMPLQQMADPRYAAAWRTTIDPAKPTASAELVRPAGFMPAPPKVPSVHESTQTTHFSVVDADGNAVASTYTLNGLFGSGVTVAGLGFLLNNEMDDFASKMGVPNMFGLIQGPANAIAPGKRPLSSMTPTIVLKDGKVALVLGSPGGSTIITTVANDLISVVDNGLNVQQAADAPRFHMQYLPDRLDVEKRFPANVANALKAMGYTLDRAGEFDEKNPGIWGDSELIERDAKTGELLGGQDQRHHFGKAAGY
jgi:gamma-glutamyltranspeptidase / glutathione hydrolase